METLYDFLSSVNFGQVTDIQKVMHMSPSCIGTGGLKKLTIKMYTFLLEHIIRVREILQSRRTCQMSGEGANSRREAMRGMCGRYTDSKDLYHNIQISKVPC